MSKLFHAAIIIVLTSGIYFLSKNPVIKPYSLYLTIFSFLILIFYTYLLKKKKESLTETRLFVYQVTIFVLLIVATTGWFISPLFFSLYFCAVFLAFMLSPSVLLGFIFSLIAIFAISNNGRDPIYSTLIISSLLTVIPISFYLRRQYLKYKQDSNEILILKQEKTKYKDKIEEILGNKITQFAVNMREPINDIRQIAYHMAELKEPEKVDKCRQDIIDSSQKLLSKLKDFEQTTTGRNLLEAS